MRVRIATSKGKTYLDNTIFTNLTFMLFSLSMFVGFIGVFIPFFYISNLAAEFAGASSTVALTLLLVMNGTSMFGRAIPGLIADKIGPLNVITTSAVVSLILLWCWIPANTIGSLFAFAVLYGMSSGCVLLSCLLLQPIYKS
jgi:predicted MFS family arabinose efflux permease